MRGAIFVSRTKETFTMYSRLTTATMYGSLMDTLMQNQRKIQDLQRQIASGNKYTNLAENPSAVARSLQVQSAINANDKYQQNTTNAVTMLRYSDGALNNVLDAAQAIRSLVIQAGNGSLDATQLKDITAQIQANKKIMLDNLNTRVAGQYIFGGTDTTTPPFAEQSDGSIIYQGSDDRIKYAVSDSMLGDVTFAGSDIVPVNDDSYFICSHYVPLDWTWQGREEKVQITVGNRTLSVFIPEDWSDNDPTKTSKSLADPDTNSSTNSTDYNQFRDPNEHAGISLEDLAEIVNRSLAEQGADMLVHVSVEKNMENGTQQLIMKSNTGEKVGITGWPDTDYMPMPATITSMEFDSTDTSWKTTDDDEAIHGITGNANILSWKGSDDSGTLSITVGGKTADIDLSEITSSTDLVNAINRNFAGLSDGTPFASLSTGNLTGRLMLQSEAGAIEVSGDSLDVLFGTEDDITSTQSAITIKLGESDDNATKIFINADDTLESLAERINSINGVCARTSADGKSLTITAQRIGEMPTDRLANNDAAEDAHYPSLTITAEGGAVNLFEFEEGQTTIKALSSRRQLDHSHIDIFDALGMETAMKSREFSPSETLTVTDDTELHWRVISGGRSADIKLNAGEYTLEQLADKLKNAGAGWLEVTLEEDSDEAALTESGTDSESRTQRLVIRGYDAEQVIFLDMNEYNYADQMGLSTALRTDGYTDSSAGTGTRCVNFPSAPCVDDNVGIPLRVQMNCGMYYDVNIKRADVVNPKTGFVDRNKVMQAIVDGVNEQEGSTIMGLTVHVDSSGHEIDDSSAIYFLSGEAFTVVDMPFNDPEWDDYSGGIAAQMGIHGGVISNLKNTAIPMQDSSHTERGTFADAYSAATGLDFEGGTIRFANMAHSVEIDVGADDTVKDVMDRLRTQAGDWLYVNYYDEHMGQEAIRNSGDYPLIAISSADGSAVSILDVKGHVGQDMLGITTGVQTRLSQIDSDGIMSDSFTWDIEGESFPATQLTLTVAGYSHTIDLTEIRNITPDADNAIQADDVAEFISARMQDYDVRAEINEDNELMIWSLRGYSVEVKFELEGARNPDVTSVFLGNEDSSRSYYRGGWNLEGDSVSRGIEAGNMYSTGMHSQNATIRSGANTMRQNGFGVINDAIAAIESGNRDDLTDKMLPKIDDFINNLLSVMSENGALQARYTYNGERLTQENAIMEETYDDLARIDPADAISQLMVADYMYQANLAVISRLIQPSLLDFLS